VDKIVPSSSSYPYEFFFTLPFSIFEIKVIVDILILDILINPFPLPSLLLILRLLKTILMGLLKQAVKNPDRYWAPLVLVFFSYVSIIAFIAINL
jgi:hypothetical protein